MRRAVLFIGVMTGTCLVVLAYSDGFHPALPAVPHLIGVTLGAVLVWLALAAVVTWLAELLRRHHKAIAAHGWRHGKRGTIAAARMAGKSGRSAASAAGKGGRSVTSRLAAWAGPRWSARLPVAGGMDRALPQAAADRRAVIEDQRLSDAQRERDANGQENVCAACGHDGTPGDPLVIAQGFRVHTSETTDPKSGYYDPASAPAPAVPATQGEEMGSDWSKRYADAYSKIAEGSTVLRGVSRQGGGQAAPAASRITPGRRAHRAAASSGGKMPSEWGQVVASAADFEPEDDAHLLAWLSDQVQGIGAYAEGLIEAYETAINSVGLDPKGLATLHDVADAAAHCAEIMNAAKHKFTEYYELPREFAANGGLAPHDGRWVTGEGG